MKILFNCNTYYQLIVAIQLRITRFKNDEVILCMSDLSQNAEKVVERLSKEKIFSEVFLIKKMSKNIKKKSAKERINICLKMLYGSKECDFGKIDLLMYYNVDEFYVHELFATLRKYNKDIKCCRFEEAYTTYNSVDDYYYPTIKLANRFRELVGMSTLVNRTEAFFCYKPKGYLGNLRTEVIPSFNINLNEIRSILTKVFDLNVNELDYSQKYIFFTSVFDFEGEAPVGEFELVNKVATIVGKDNLLIKTHPRDRRNIYLKNGFKVDQNSHIPWEVIQLNYDFSKHILLALNSSSLLLVTTNLQESPKVGYLYNCVNLNKNKAAIEVKKSTDILLKQMADEKGFENVYVINNVEDIINL